MASETETTSSSSNELQFCPYHNVRAMLLKPKEAHEFIEIIDFLQRSNIAFALTVNPTIYKEHIKQFWNTAQVQTELGVRKINATVDGRQINITESTIRTHLHFQDEAGISWLPNQTLFETFQRMGYEGNLRSTTFQKALVSKQWRFIIHVFQ